MSDTFLTLLLAMIGSTGLCSLVQFFFSRKFKKDDDKDLNKKQLDSIEKTVKNIDYDSRLNDSQTHLLIMINHYPKDHKAIISEAEKYFCELGGDSWVYGIVKNWASKEGVNIDYITHIHEKNILKNKK